MARRPLSRHLADLCRENAEREPDGIALLAGDDRLTNLELKRRAERIGAGLQAAGVVHGGTVGLLCTNRSEWVTTALGAMWIGARVAAFNTFVKAWDLGQMLAHSQASVLVTLDQFRTGNYLGVLKELGVDRAARGRSKKAPALTQIFVIGEPEADTGQRRFDELIEHDQELADVPTSAVDVGYLLYTSGSSARPKAVPLQQYGLVENSFQIGERMGLTAADRVWVPVPLFWAYGACNAMTNSLSHGAALVLQEAFEPGEALDLIERHRCTAGYLLPNIARALLEHPDFDTRRTRTLRTGLTLGPSAEVRAIAEELAIPQICNIYGQTETYGNCCVTPADWSLERRCAGQGTPLPGVELRIRDENGAELGPGEVGLLEVRGYVTPGYLDAEVDAPIDSAGWFTTGDLASLDQEGGLHFAARQSEMIKTGGINVAPLEVEEFLATHPQVVEAAVVGAEDERVGEAVVAFVVAPEESEADLRAWCKEHLAAYKVPARIHLLESLDRTDTGKIALRSLIERDRNTQRQREPQPR